MRQPLESESESKDVEMNLLLSTGKLKWKKVWEARSDSWVLEMKMKQLDPWAQESKSKKTSTETQLKRTRKWKWKQGLPESWSLKSESKSKYALEH